MLELRKTVTYVENLHSEIGRPVDPPIRSAIVAAVITNPWAGQGYVEDLEPVIADIAPRLAAILVPEMISVMGGPSGILAFGKAAVVGLDGEIEHASALIHTLRFGNVFRAAAEATEYISFINKRGPAGTTITIPMCHKGESAKRDYFLTTEAVIPDAPNSNEIVVAIAAASGGRPFARIGDRYRDMELGNV